MIETNGEARACGGRTQAFPGGNDDRHQFRRAQARRSPVLTVQIGVRAANQPHGRSRLFSLSADTLDRLLDTLKLYAEQNQTLPERLYDIRYTILGNKENVPFMSKNVPFVPKNVPPGVSEQKEHTSIRHVPFVPLCSGVHVP